MNDLITALYFVSDALLQPVVAGLLIMFAVAVVGLGVHAAEALERRRDHRRFTAAIAALQAAPDRGAAVRALFADRDYRGHLGRFLAAGRDLLGRPRDLSQAIDGVESSIDRRVSRALLLQRMGPMLGLMGTLIPMGPALTDLAAGDIQGMAQKLVVAFTTTVLGLAVAALAYLVAAARRRWYAADLRAIEYMYDLAVETGSKDQHDRP